MKKCRNCSSEVPFDSDFCPYCGSSNLYNEIDNANHNNQQTVHNDKNQNEKSYKTAFIVTIIVCVLLGIYILANLGNDVSNNANNDITYINDSDKYTEAIGIANQNCSSSFHPNTFVVKGTNKKIRIFYNYNGTVSWESNYYGTLDHSEFSDWKTDSNGISYFDITIKCSADAYGTIKFTNDYNSENFTIYFTGK